MHVQPNQENESNHLGAHHADTKASQNMEVVGLYETDKDLSPYSVCILVPCGGYDVPNKVMKCISNLIAYSWSKGLKVWQVGITTRMVVHWARNELANQGLNLGNPYTKEPYTHFLWLDDDMLFNPDLAIKLIEHDLDMVSALYYGRERHLPVIYVKTEDDLDEYKHYPLIEVPNNLFEVDACGFGAMMMNRSVLERMPYPWFTLDGAGEDISFCVHAKRKGIKIYCDSTYKLGHMAERQVVCESTYKQYIADRPEYMEKKRVELIN